MISKIFILSEMISYFISKGYMDTFDLVNVTKLRKKYFKFVS